GGEQVAEATGDLHAEAVGAARAADEVPLVGEGPYQVVGSGQRDVAPLRDLLGVEPFRAVPDLFEDPERARDALDQIGRPPRQHLNRSPAATCAVTATLRRPDGADRPSVPALSF